MGDETVSLTCSLPWISRGWIRLSQLLTGADCPTDRRLSTATATRIKPVMAHLLIVSASGLKLVRAKNWCIKVQRLIPHELSPYCLHVCCNLGLKVDKMKGLLAFIQKM